MSSGTDLATLLDSEQVLQLLRSRGLDVATVIPTYVRSKPGESTIIAYELTGAGTTMVGYARWCGDPDRAATIHQKALAMRPRPTPIGPGLVRLGATTTLFVSPNDARLRRLRWYIDPQKLKRTMHPLAPMGGRWSARSTEVRVLRYKPERRIVLQTSLGARNHDQTDVVIRYSTARQAARHAQVVEALVCAGVSTPRQLSRMEEDRVSVDEFIPAGTLLDAISSGADVDPSRLSEELQRFHHTRIPLRLSERHPATEVERARSGLFFLSQWYRGLEGLCTELERGLERDTGRPSPMATLHGDLHQKNVLHSTAALHFIDLDRVATGPAEIDLGYLLAHAIAIEIRRPGWSPASLDFAHQVIGSYFDGSGQCSELRLGLHTAVGLIDQALHVARRLEADGEGKCAAILRAALDQLCVLR